jgi:hypothetical protein
MKTTWSPSPPVAAEVTRRTRKSIHHPPPHVGGYALTLRRSTLQALTLFAAAALFTHTAFAAKPGPTPPPLENWQTVDAFTDASNSGLTAAPNGALYAVGTGYPSERGVIRASTDGGFSWSVLDQFVFPGFYRTIYSAIVSDSVGNLYVAGSAFDDGSLPDDVGGPVHWFVRQSTDGGATWTTVDDFAPGGGFWAYDDFDVHTLAVDASGNVFAGFFAVSDSSAYHRGNWTIRKGAGGTAFTTVDTSPFTSAYGPKGIYAHPTTGIFAVGDGAILVTNKNKTTSTSGGWLVRRSLDGGATWQNIDAYQLSSGYFAQANAVGTDASGNLYVVGSGRAFNNGLNTWHWIVRKSTNSGTTWTTVDNFQLEANNHSSASCFATDAFGNLFVAGSGNQGPWDGTGSNIHWTVRKSAGGTGAWTTVDYLQSGGTAANAITAAFGKVFVGGNGGGGWLVRRSP